MLASSASASFLDDPGVLAELETLDTSPPRPSALSGPLFLADIEDLDRGLASSRSPGARGAFRSPDALVTSAGASVLETADSSLVWRLPYVAVWLFLMSLGASAAALLFRARVAELISRWTI